MDLASQICTCSENPIAIDDGKDEGKIYKLFFYLFMHHILYTKPNNKIVHVQAVCLCIS